MGVNNIYGNQKANRRRSSYKFDFKYRHTRCEWNEAYVLLCVTNCDKLSYWTSVHISSGTIRLFNLLYVYCARLPGDCYAVLATDFCFG